MSDMTVSQIQKQYKTLLDSVFVVEGIIAGSHMPSDKQNDKSKTIDRNVEHMKYMLTKDFWTTEDMSSVQKAIFDGENYLVENPIVNEQV